MKILIWFLLSYVIITITIYFWLHLFNNNNMWFAIWLNNKTKVLKIMCILQFLIPLFYF